ncbi:helix-turn-helix domain-containing protein [Deinococcus detaillensis]|uniref:Helix-turn-helix domain-containing protein n=1 Tax=Deinococcus detaillensis TaxID=2592048 RepID=A0A553V4R7_9DEIO|nr:helix-turn-helix domain-containing protein [Deinococcus detaillensis]TSA87467.1 helix-turn-helix domain-containing protein [Deinococcus detaillensis]
MPIAGSRRLVAEGQRALAIIRAVDSETRLSMLSLLSHSPMNVSELTAAIGLPHSTVNFNLKLLEAAGLLDIQYMPGTRGRQKLISKRYEEILIQLPGAAISAQPNVVEISMPIGNYRFSDVAATCGLATESKLIGMVDDPRSFFEPEHVFAQIIWFRHGSLGYEFPNNLPHGAEAVELEVSFELCSEAPEHDLDWPSDITVWLNGTEIGTWTSPADFGGSRGKLTPLWWPINHSQYGVLKRFKVNREGSFIDGKQVSDVTLSALDLMAQPQIQLKIGVKSGARHQGGVNLYGRKFGNCEQDILMRLWYEFREGERPYVIK